MLNLDTTWQDCERKNVTNPKWLVNINERVIRILEGSIDNVVGIQHVDDKSRVGVARVRDEDKDGQPRTVFNVSPRTLNIEDKFLANLDSRTLELLEADDETTVELEDALASEIAGELADTWLTTIVNNATRLRVDIKGEWVGVTVDNLMSTIRDQSEQIGISSRRGTANFIVVTPIVLSLLQVHKDSTFRSSKNDGPRFSSILSLMHVGTLDNNIDVYCSVVGLEGDQVLVGWKSIVDAWTSSADAGVVVGLQNLVALEETDKGHKLVSKLGIYTDGDTKKYYSLIDLGEISFI